MGDDDTFNRDAVIAAIRSRNLETRDSLRRYLVVKQEELRAKRPRTKEMDAELLQLQGWIQWLRGA